MATRSFDLELVLDTDETLQNFLVAMEIAKKRAPLVLPDFREELAKGDANIPDRCPFGD